MFIVQLAAVLALDAMDLLKLLGIVAAAVALFLLAKRVGRGGETIGTLHPAPVPEPEPEVALKEEPEGPDPDQPGYSPETDVDEVPGRPPEHIRIENWNFSKFDLVPGPPDRNAFADELNMQLYDPSTGRRWMQTYFVATPDGLNQMLRDHQWNYMFVPQILVLDRYDVGQLRSAMLEELGAAEAERGEVLPHSAE